MEFQKSALIIVLAILKMSSMLKLVEIHPVVFSQSTLASKCDIAVYNRKPPVKKREQANSFIYNGLMYNHT